MPCDVSKLLSFPAVRFTHTVCMPGDHSEGVPPVPISNTEVKPFSADGTALRGGRVGRCQAFFIYNINKNKHRASEAFFVSAAQDGQHGKQCLQPRIPSMFPGNRDFTAFSADC